MKEIDIPFGAKDSELKGWEYTIPEGMEAEIKDGKIVVREKESEDERIRKWIASYIHHGVFTEDEHPMALKAVEWLEKQKEQPTNEEMLRTLRAEYEKGVADTIAKYEQEQKRKFKLGDKVRLEGDEVNTPLTITGMEEDRYLTDSAYGSILYSDEDNWEIVEQKLFNVCEQCPYYKDCPDYNEKKQEWSEEDESEFTAVIYCVSRAIKASKDENERNSLLSAKKWLQDKLSFRVQSIRPQSIQLKEAYKDGFQTARHAIALAFMNYLDENRPDGKMCLSNGECEEIKKAFFVGDWAKIMRYYEKYRSSWKPSEEQIATLGQWLKDKQFDGDSRYVYPIFESLYEQLKKL